MKKTNAFHNMKEKTSLFVEILQENVYLFSLNIFLINNIKMNTKFVKKELRIRAIYL
jgi:hypothetical protein